MNVLSLAERMKQRGWPMVIYGRSDSILAEQAHLSGIKFTHIGSEFKFGDLVNARRLAREFAIDGVEVLINYLNRDIFLSVLAKRFFKTKSKAPLSLFYYQHEQLGIDRRDTFHSWLYNNLDCWIALLPSFINSLKARTKLDISKALVIPFGIDVERFTTNLPTSSEARQALNLPQDATIVGVIGRLDQKKSQHTLIEALAEFKTKCTDIHVLILGDKTHGEAEKYEQLLHDFASDLSLTDRVHFRPHREDVQIGFAALDVFVLTSESETYGMVTLEAQASGVPTIGTNAGGTRELIDDGVTGLLFDYQAANGLAKCIERIVADKEFVAKLSETARARIESDFSYQNQCALLENAIKKLSNI